MSALLVDGARTRTAHEAHEAHEANVIDAIAKFIVEAVFNGPSNKWHERIVGISDLRDAVLAQARFTRPRSGRYCLSASRSEQRFADALAQAEREGWIRTARWCGTIGLGDNVEAQKLREQWRVENAEHLAAEAAAAEARKAARVAAHARRMTPEHEAQRQRKAAERAARETRKAERAAAKLAEQRAREAANEAEREAVQARRAQAVERKRLRDAAVAAAEAQAAALIQGARVTRRAEIQRSLKAQACGTSRRIYRDMHDLHRAPVWRGRALRLQWPEDENPLWELGMRVIDNHGNRLGDVTDEDDGNLFHVAYYSEDRTYRWR